MATTFAVPLTMDDIKLFERHALNTLSVKPLDLMAGQTLRLTTYISDQDTRITKLEALAKMIIRLADIGELDHCVTTRLGRGEPDVRDLVRDARAAIAAARA